MLACPALVGGTSLILFVSVDAVLTIINNVHSLLSSTRRAGTKNKLEWGGQGGEGAEIETPKEAKSSFYRAAHAIFGKMDSIASEEVTLQLLKTKCILILLYGLEACPLTKSQISSLDFVINRFLVKLFNTNDMEIINHCRDMLHLNLPSVTLNHRTGSFVKKFCQCDNFFVKSVLHL